MKRALFGLCATLIALGFWAAVESSAAVAFFAGGGEGLGLALVTTLPSPTVSAKVGNGEVKLAWSDVVAPEGAGGVTYYVRRDGGPAGPGCPSEAAPSTAQSCTEQGLKPGSTYTFAVVARWRSWAAESEAVQVTLPAGEASYLAVEAARATVSAGEGDPLTITVRSATGAVDSAFSGPHQLRFAGAQPSPNGTAPTVTAAEGKAIPFGEPVTLDFKAGVATVEGSANGLLTLYRSGVVSVIARAETVSNERDPLALTVVPGPFAAFGLVPEPAAPEAGATLAMVVSATDRYGNTITTYVAHGRLSFSGALPSPAPADRAPQYPPPAVPAFQNGVARLSGFVLYRAGQTTLNAQEEGSGHGGTVTFVVRPAPPTQLRLSATKTTALVGEGVPLTATALDPYDNVATSYGGAAGETKDLTFSGARPGPNRKAPTVTNEAGEPVPFGNPTALRFVEGTATTVGQANGVATFYHVETAKVVARAERLSNEAEPLALTIKPGRAVQFALEVEPATVQAGQPLAVRLTALDQGGNTATSFGGPAGEQKALTYSGPETSPNGTAPLYPSSATEVNFKEGVGSASGIVLYKAGTTALTVRASEAVGQATLTVQAGAPYSLSWSEPQVSAGHIAPGCALECLVEELGSEGRFSARVAVSDRYGNPQREHERLLVLLAQRRLRGSGIGRLSTFLLALPAGSTVSEPFTFTAPATFGGGRRGRRGGGRRFQRYLIELQARPFGGEKLRLARARLGD